MQPRQAGLGSRSQLGSRLAVIDCGMNNDSGGPDTGIIDSHGINYPKLAEKEI